MKKWTAQWIEPTQSATKEEPVFTLQQMFSGEKIVQEPIEDRLLPSQCLKRIFETNPNKRVKKATLEMTAHGIYTPKINGQLITNALFTPDNTSYHKYLMYQEYDITTYLRSGENIWSVTVADGWYAGRISVNGASAQFGNKLGILGELTINYTDGSKEIIPTDERFYSKTDKYVYSDIFIGEKQDLRLLDDSWETSFSVEGMRPVEIAHYSFDNLTPQFGPYVTKKDELKPKKIWLEKSSIIVDFGQVLAGRIVINTFLEEGQELVIEHSETLDENGMFFNNILGRNKDQKDIFIGRGRKEKLEAEFTFHGFRYVRLNGIKQLNAEDVTAFVLYSDLKDTGTFTTNNEKVNQLIKNIYWSQRGNLLSIPTDCPQRERVGWTGDMQVFAPTATFFMDIYDFTHRWLKNVALEQLENGEILDYTPAPRDFLENPTITGSFSSSGWGDAIIMVPWTLYERYGNLEILEEFYPSMLKWHNYSKNSAATNKEGLDQFIWDTKFHYGDWMFPSFMIGDNPKGPIATSEVTKDLFATAFLAKTSKLLSKIATLLDKKNDALTFESYSKNVKKAFENRFFVNNRLTADYQGCYVIAVAFDLIPEKKDILVARLAELIKNNQYRLDTGFLSIPYLLDVLCDSQRSDIAKKVFLQEECPSWLYEVNNGATTIWESWAGIQPNGKVMDFSFNHYAFGCVGDWMIRKIAGLKVKEPGYKEFYIKPNLDLGVEEFELVYDSPQGEIKISTKNKQIDITVPEGAIAFVTLNNGMEKQKLKDGKYTFSI